jgi:hypothetical protein
MQVALEFMGLLMTNISHATFVCELTKKIAQYFFPHPLAVNNVFCYVRR